MTEPENTTKRQIRVWALGDPHLSFARPKPMDVFGPQWANHPEKIARNAAKLVEPGDLFLIPGDLSWAMRRNEAEPDLAFLANLPGTKVLIKGNHDYWWDSDRSLNYPGLHDTPYIAENGTIGVAGTRGWDEMPEGATASERARYDRQLERELRRLERRLESIRHCKRKYALIHYPPLPEFAPLLKSYAVECVLYGHVHLSGRGGTLPENWQGLRCICVAADRIGFMPRLIDTVLT